MATHAAYRLRTMLDNARAIVAIELLAAVRGIGFRRPLRTSESLERAIALVVPSEETGDRFIAPDIERVADLIRSGTFTSLVDGLFDDDR
jgi:histidine ammonia-lyase